MGTCQSKRKKNTGTSQSKPTYKTPNESIQSFADDFIYPPLYAPTDHNPSLTTPTDQTVEGDLEDVQTPNWIRMCCSCQRLEPIGVESSYTSFADGRYLCSNCLSIMITVPKEFEYVIRQVHNFFECHLELPMEKDIPIYLVDQNEMRRLAQEITSEDDVGIIYGMCFNKEDTINIVEGCVQRGHDIEAITTTKTVKGDKVSAILVLYGLPKQVLGTTLAHEMVHAWIALQGWKSKMENKVEEAICEAVAYRWLKYIAGDYDESYTQKDAEFAAKLTAILKSMIKAGNYNSCGAEFPLAKRAVKKHGLEYTVMYTVHGGSLPSE